MIKKLLIITVIFFFASSHVFSVSSDDAKSFAEDYSKILTEYKNKLKTVKTREEYQNLLGDAKGKLEGILKKYKNSTYSDELELLRCKVLLDLSRMDEADEKADNLIKKKSKLSDEAKMIKVRVLMLSRKIAHALTVFRKIEDKIKRGEDYFNMVLSFGLISNDMNVREEYSNKFLNSKDLPENMSHLRANAYKSLSMIAMEKNDPGKSKEMLKKAISSSKDPRLRMSFEMELEQLNLLGKSSPPISAEVWVNSKPLSLDTLKGKVVIVDFWATWCNPCRMVIPVLLEEYKKHKDKGLEVIGFTKLYGRYRDDKVVKPKVNKQEEISLIKEFVKRHNINYPVAISFEGMDFEKYKISGIPTMVFVDRKGNIDYIKIGAGQPQFIRDKIKKLLE